MEDFREKRRKIVLDVEKKLAALDETVLKEKRTLAIDRLFDFANFMEARIVLLYLARHAMETDSREIIEKSYDQKKIVVLPRFDRDKKQIRFYKVDDFSCLSGKTAEDLAPDPKKCKEMSMEHIDIALVPGALFDEKGGRIGSADDEYDKMMMKLPLTTRKVAVTIEEQVIPQIPMEPKGRFLDILVTDKRVIYKI